MLIRFLPFGEPTFMCLRLLQGLISEESGNLRGNKCKLFYSVLSCSGWPRKEIAVEKMYFPN